MAIDLTWTSYFAPLLVFLIVTVLTWVFLVKLDLPGNAWVKGFLALFIGMLFVSTTKTTRYFSNLVPWLSVVAIVIFLILLVAVFAMGDVGGLGKALAWIGVIIAIIIAFSYSIDVFPDVERARDWFWYDKDVRDNWIFVIVTAVVGFLALKK